MLPLTAIHHRLHDDLEFFMEHAPLNIKTKTGEVVKFKMNRAQRYIHNQLEKQMREKGWVRACILKGRQQGCSTYTSARFYHKTTRNRGISTFILSHDGQTTEKLFKMVKRYQEYINPALKPEEGAANRHQLTFPTLEGDYTVGTAGNENVGRGSTSQLFHGSEAAYWEHADEIQDGALESIGRVPGTEIILESTANGPVGLFYRKCMDAIHGKGDYILIFVPWHWQEEYEADYDETIPLSEEEQIYLSQNLSEYPKAQALKKIAWRRLKIIDLCTSYSLESGLRKFRQIYPANPIEAFQASGSGLVDPAAIMAARKAITITDDNAPLIMGVDSAGAGEDADRTILAFRRGRVFQEYLSIPKMQNMDMALAGVIAKEITARGVDMCFVDVGYGHGTIDRLHELGYRYCVQGVGFGERALRPDVYLNKRSEMLIEAAGWVNDGGVRIPDDDALHADLSSVPLDETTSNGLKYIKPKKEIKKLLGGKSTDIFDAFALTFAYPVRRSSNQKLFKKKEIGSGQGGFKKEGGGSPLASVRRARRREAR